MKKQLNNDGSNIKFLDVCSGIGLTRLALEMANWECVGRFETDKVADSIYKTMFGEDEPNFGDVSSLPMLLPDFDVLVAGIPGNTYSQVFNKYKRPDSSVPFGIVSILKMYRPKAFILECVASFTSERHNPSYSIFCSAIDCLGYDVQIATVSAEKCGLPLKTKRHFMVGSLTGFPAYHPMLPYSSISLKDCLVDEFNEELDTTTKQWSEYMAKSGTKLTVADLHRLDDYTIIDRRQTDLRTYHNKCPSLRKGNHGLFYVKKGHIKKISAYEAMLLNGVPKCIAYKYLLFASSQHDLLSFVGASTPVPLIFGLACWLGTFANSTSTKMAA